MLANTNTTRCPALSPGDTTPVVSRVDSVRERTAVSSKGRKVRDRRYVVSGRRRYDRRAIHEFIRHYDKTASRLAPKGDDGGFHFYVATNGRND
jgi:hypothetical protein